MSDVFASATVTITPSLTGFVKDLEGQLKEKMKNVKPVKIKVAPALTADFVGSLRKQVNAAILQAQKGIKPIRVKALIEPIGVSGRTVGHIAPPGAGGVGRDSGATGRVSSGLAALARSQEHVATAQLHLNAAYDKTLPLEQQVSAVTKVNTSLTEAQAAAEKTLVKAIVSKDAALQRSTRKQLSAIADFQRTFAPRAAEVSPVAPVAPAVSTSQKAIENARFKTFSEVRSASRGLRDASAAAEKLGKDTRNLSGATDILTTRQVALRDATKAVTQAEKTSSDKRRVFAQNLQNVARQAVKNSEDQIAAIRKLSKEESKRARNTAQLSRGGQATLLSLAGIRGATLAASRSFLVGAATITVFAKAVQAFAALETNMHVFQATTAATADQMEAVRAEARKLGADLTLPSVSAGDAAGAMVELAKAGLSVQDSIAGARGVLELATAAAIDNAAAVQLVANALNSFQLQGSQAVAVADTFANAANLAQGSIADIGTAFQQASAAGRQVGLSFQDTATFLTILAKNGLRGADSGTSLRTALIRLVNPSKAAAKAFKDLGIQVRDAQGNLRPDVFIQIAEAARKLGPAQRDATIALIGGQDAFRAITILGRQSIDSFLKLRAALRVQGSAAALATARTKGLHGAMDGLQSVLETVGTDAASKVGPGLANAVRGFSTLITAIGQSNIIATTLQGTLDSLGTTLRDLGIVAQKTFQGFDIPFTNFNVGVKSAANGALQLINSIGVGTILAGVAAYKILGGTVARLSTVFGQATKFTVGFAVAENTALFSMAGLRAGLVGIASSFNVYLLAAAAATAGLVFLLTRQSASEKAFSRAQKATEALANAYGELQTASEAVASAQRSFEQLETGLTQAVLNRTRAQQALAASTADPGSTEHRQLLLDLKVTTQDVTFATQDYNTALKNLHKTEESIAAAEDLRNETRKAEVKTVRDLLSVSRQQAIIHAIENRQPIANAEERRVVILNEQISVLRKLSQENIHSSNTDQQSLGRRQAAFLGFIRAANDAGRKVKPIVLPLILKAPNLVQGIKNIVATMTFVSEAARRAFISNLVNLSGLGPKISDQLIREINGAVHTAAEWAKRKGAPIGESLGTSAVEGFKATFDITDALAIAVAQGLSKAQQLVIAQTNAAAAQAKFNTINTKTKGGTEFTGPKQSAALVAAANAANAANAEVTRIQGEITSDAQNAAQKIKDAQDKRDKAAQNIVDVLLQGRKATLLQRRITTAGLSAWLGDDLKTNKAWLKYLQGLKNVLTARLKAAGASKAVIQQAMKQLSDLIFSTKNDIKKTADDIEANTKQRQADRFSRILERADLGVSLAEARTTSTNKNIPGLLRAHRARLKAIQIELARVREQYGKNSLEWLRLKVTEQQEIQAINELKGTTAERNNALSKLAFEFLQAQQGFTASLLGNLFPTNPTPLSGGTGGVSVGGGGGGPTGGGGGGIIGSFPGPNLSGNAGSPLAAGPSTHGGPGSNLARTQAVSGTNGSTAGQMSMLIAVNQKMLAVLQILASDTKHPGAKGNARAQRDRHIGTHR